MSVANSEIPEACSLSNHSFANINDAVSGPIENGFEINLESSDGEGTETTNRSTLVSEGNRRAPLIVIVSLSKEIDVRIASPSAFVINRVLVSRKTNS